MRPRYRCHRFGALLQWGNRFLSWIRVRSCDYSHVTRVRVLLTFLTTSLRYLCIFASLGVTWCDTPSFLAYPHVFLTCGPFIGFLGFFGVRQLASIAKTITAPILLLALHSAALLAFFSEFRDFRASFGSSSEF